MAGYKKKAVADTPSLAEGFATLRRTTVKSWGSKDDIQSEDERMEEQIPVKSLVSGDPAAAASVTASVSTKMSDAVYYPPNGTWDKIPYSVEVFSSVTLKCDQDSDTIKSAHEMAYDLAWDSSREHILKAVAGHTVDIKQRLCPGYFSEEG